MNKILPLVLSYLDAEPSSKYNHIFSTPNKLKESTATTIPLRTSQIGLAQYYICYNRRVNDKMSKAEKVSIRIETYVENGYLKAFSSRAHAIRNAEMLIIKDTSANVCYISKENGNKWLVSSLYATADEEVTPYGLRTVYKYDLNKLMADEKISMLIKDDNGKVKEVTGPLMRLKTISEHKYDSYFLEVEECKHRHVDRDRKSCAGVYYGFGDMKITCYKDTVKSLSHTVSLYTGLSEKTVYQRLQRAKRDTVLGLYNTPAAFKFSKKGFDDFCAMYDNNELCNKDMSTLVVWLSYENGPIIEPPTNKTENMKDYQKDYQKENEDKIKDYQKGYQKDYYEKNSDSQKMKAKIRAWLKRHNGEMNPKWNDDERKIAESLLAK